MRSVWWQAIASCLGMAGDWNATKFDIATWIGASGGCFKLFGMIFAKLLQILLLILAIYAHFSGCLPLSHSMTTFLFCSRYSFKDIWKNIQLTELQYLFSKWWNSCELLLLNLPKLITILSHPPKKSPPESQLSERPTCQPMSSKIPAMATLTFQSRFGDTIWSEEGLAHLCSLLWSWRSGNKKEIQEGLKTSSILQERTSYWSNYLPSKKIIIMSIYWTITISLHCQVPASTSEK